ncbi:hypothetical protein [Thermoplasma sp.]|uniref:hypothetical protein n=1 Tax=Thermoplasma sp. TaxID=1973142 RepID=UPI0025D76621|nr:hypothetical protein [Thermoplasma sp.]
MDDVETIKIIKEKETSADEEIEQFKQEQEKLVREAMEKESLDIEKTEGELKSRYQEYLESRRKEAEEKAAAIIESAKERSASMNLSLKESDLQKMLLDIIMQYLEE